MGAISFHCIAPRIQEPGFRIQVSFATTYAVTRFQLWHTQNLRHTFACHNRHKKLPRNTCTPAPEPFNLLRFNIIESHPVAESYRY